jgi:DNA end-binding protein Ku
MARPIWKGAITFGLVSIPVEVHTAVQNRQLHFHLLTAEGKSRVKYQRVAEKSGKAVDWDDLVKGYEYEKGRFVVLTKEDFEAAALEKTKTIDILDFVKAEQIDDRFFDKPYYVTPAAGGDHAYALLRETIRDAGRTGIAKFVLREKQYLAAVEVIEDALVLSTLRFADELVDISEYRFPKTTGMKANELKMARMLVDELASDWDPEKYTDDYRENLLRSINAKKKGREVELAAEEPERSEKVVDLMERLRSSLEGAGRGRRASRRPARRTATASRPHARSSSRKRKHTTKAA